MTSNLEDLRGRGDGKQMPEVDETTYSRFKGELERQGYTFFVQIRPISVPELLKEDDQRAALGKERIFEVNRVDPLVDPVDLSGEMKTSIPPEIEIAISPGRAKILEGHGLHADAQKKIIEEDERKRLADNMPEVLQGLVSVRMPTASEIVQVYMAYKEKYGVSLFEGWFARAADKLSPEKGLARVGQYPTDKGMRVRGPDRKKGVNDVYPFAVVVMPTKAA